MTTPNLAMPEIVESQASKYLTHNDALRIIDGLAQAVVQDYTATPPGAPTDGKCWLVGASATGVWAGHDQEIAQYYDAAWYFIMPAQGWAVHNLANSLRYWHNGTAWVKQNLSALVLTCSDETTALAAATDKFKFRMPYKMTLTGVRASLSTAQASGNIFTVDVNEGGATILSTKLTIDNTESTSTTAATPAVVSDAVLADDAEISVDIDQIGDGTAKGLKLTLLGYQS